MALKCSYIPNVCSDKQINYDVMKIMNQQISNHCVNMFDIQSKSFTQFANDGFYSQH